MATCSPISGRAPSKFLKRLFNFTNEEHTGPEASATGTTFAPTFANLGLQRLRDNLGQLGQSCSDSSLGLDMFVKRAVSRWRRHEPCQVRPLLAEALQLRNRRHNLADVLRLRWAFRGLHGPGKTFNTL